MQKNDEFLGRIRAFQRLLKDSQIDTAIVLQNVDVYYFTGTMQKSYLFIPKEGDFLFFVKKNFERAKAESPFTPIYFERDKEVIDLARERGILKGNFGMELDVVPAQIYLRWKELLNAREIYDISPLIRDLRMVKSDYEISQIKRAGEMLDMVFEKAREVLKEGMSELEVASILESYGRSLGHTGIIRMRGFNSEMDNITITQGALGTVTGFSDAPIIGYGLYSAMPHGASYNRLVRDLPILIDCGFCYEGYLVDETRPFIIGELKEPFLKAYEVSLEIIETVKESGKEGVSAKDIYMIASKIVKKSGLDEYFMGYGEGKVGFLGHGFGLEINEFPVITPKHDIILMENMVFAVEPKFIFLGQGVMGIEVDFIVRKDGLERVTKGDFQISFLK